MLPKIYCRTHYLPYIEFEIADQQSKTLSMYLQYQNRLTGKKVTLHCICSQYYELILTSLQWSFIDLNQVSSNLSKLDCNIPAYGIFSRLVPLHRHSEQNDVSPGAISKESS